MSASLAVVDDQQQQQQHNDDTLQQQQNVRAAQSSLKTILFGPFHPNSLAREQRKLQTALEILETFPTLAQLEWEDTQHCLTVRTTPLAYFVQHINRIITAWQNGSVPTQQQQQQDESPSLLPMLQKVYELYPPAIRTPNLRGRLPLHEACSALSLETNNNTHGVLDFLMERFPGAARWADESGQYPFHHALQSTTRSTSSTRRIQQQQYKPLCETLERLLDLYPAVLQMRDLGGCVPLDRALVDECHCGSAILQMLFQRSLSQTQRAYALPWCPVDDDEDILHEDDDDDDDDSEQHSRNNRNSRNGSTSSSRLNIRTTLDVADAVAVLFPRLDRFAVLGSLWTVEGRHSLLQSLGSSDSAIRDLSLRLPRHLWEEPTVSQQQQKETTSSQTLLEHLLQHAQSSTSSSRLRRVSFFGQATGSRNQDHHHVQDFGYDNPAFESIRNGIVNHNNNNHQRLVELNLHQFRLGTDCRTGVSPVSLLQSLLFSPRAPRLIGLSEIVVEGGNWFGSSALITTAQPKAVLEELKLQHLTGDWVYHLLEDLAVMGSLSALKKLTVDSCQTNSENGNKNKKSNIHDGDDKLALLKPIAKILRTTKLESLTVRGLHAAQIDGALLPQCNQYLELTRALTHNNHLMEYCVHHTLKVSESDSALEQQQQQQQQQHRGKHSASIRSKIKADLVNILEVHNTTLRDVRVTVVELGDDRVKYSLPASAIEMEQDRQIDQFTQLNRFGRKEARTLATAKDRFVQLLANVTIRSAAGENGRRKALTTESMHNVLYNLLRETPSIWRGCVSRGIFRDNGDGLALHRRKRPKQAKLTGDERS